ncbi:MAG: hypothetical protein J5637_07105 [Prevotella sp.]|nr:hypothetical protein [Prevotella sp.]
MKKVCFSLSLLAILLIGCQGNKTEESEQLPDDEKCSCPPTVMLQPCNDFTQAEAKALIPKIQNVITESAGIELDFDVLPTIQLSDSLLNDAKTRYRADKIIRSIKENHHDVIIVLTHQDISCTLRGKADWGVNGLSIMSNHYVCVVSDFRIKNKKRDLWKVAAHEFFHAYCSLPHCPDDDPNCLMQDAKGHPNYTTKEHLCKNCTEKCKI